MPSTYLPNDETNNVWVAFFFFFLQEKFILSYISLKFNNKYSPLTPPKTDEKWEGKRRLLNWVITQGSIQLKIFQKHLIWFGVVFWFWGFCWFCCRCCSEGGWNFPSHKTFCEREVSILGFLHPFVFLPLVCVAREGQFSSLVPMRPRLGRGSPKSNSCQASKSKEESQWVSVGASGLSGPIRALL